jgi:8-oxo-dGTP pyrophosphatase MutT (NUDIX family)
MPGGHVEPGELPAAALARELREELGIDVAAPSGPPLREVRADTFHMQIWLIEAWTGSPVNAAPDEHDAISWFTEDALGELRLAHHSYRELFGKVLAERRAFPSGVTAPPGPVRGTSLDSAGGHEERP